MGAQKWNGYTDLGDKKWTGYTVLGDKKLTGYMDYKKFLVDPIFLPFPFLKNIFRDGFRDAQV